MEEIEAMQAVSSALEPLDSKARGRVLDWAIAKFDHAAAGLRHEGGEAPKPVREAAKPSKKSGGKASSKTGKKAKVVISIDKNLNLIPRDKVTAEQFAKQKSPSNHLEKGLVAVYYLSRILDIESVNLSQVYTFYKHLGWEVPANLANCLRKAGVEGWLDTSDQNDLKVAVGGENKVEHRMGKVE